MLQRRPLVLSGLAALAAPGAVLAQAAPGKVWRIGVLSLSFPNQRWSFWPALAAMGYVEGRNLVVDFRYAEGKAELLPQLAAELVASKPDLLIGPLSPDAAALKKATSTIPIVMIYASVPVQTGLIASLANPGGNLTGTTTVVPETAGKMTQLLRETVPRMSRVAWMGDPDYPAMDLYIKAAEQAAAAMKLRWTHLPVRTLADLDAALASMERERPDGLGVAMTGPLVVNVNRVIEFAARHKLPTLYSIEPPVRRGGLMSYGQDYKDIHSRVAWMIDKIFKGAKPSDIPVEEPARFNLIINMKTANAMGLVIPPIVLLQATELIE